MNANKTRVDVFNGLLRGEIAAAETYQQAIEKLNGQKEAAELRSFHDDHVKAANDLRKHVHDLGGKPDQGSGAWGAFAKAVEGTAKVFGTASALKALKEGEEHGLANYKSAAENNELGPTCRTLVNRLMNETRGHVSSLDQLISAT